LKFLFHNFKFFFRLCNFRNAFSACCGSQRVKQCNAAKNFAKKLAKDFSLRCDRYAAQRSQRSAVKIIFFAKFRLILVNFCRSAANLFILQKFADFLNLL